MMRILIKYAFKDRKKILEEIDKLTAEILSMVSVDALEEFKNNLEKKLTKFEEDVTSKKQGKFIRDFKDYQSGRILTFHRKYDYMYTENEREPPAGLVENNTGEHIREVEKSDVSDSNQWDVSDSISGKGSGADRSVNRSNFLKQFRLFNQGRTDSRKAGVEEWVAEEEELCNENMRKEKKIPGQGV
ncbi:hypothetical protein NDU88_004927 [Pleurodeles waltl]|uniref:Uncharacterized protein n=1 Tax=Pleurodeles waltl TaxID=8319 RepID=A0AAV7NL28_PLEWA|nr:hypothetical protein NDU88_004927 [Pleurodeles waltl]